MISPAAQTALDALVARDDAEVVGLVLTGSAARGLATERSDVDVYVVRLADGGQQVVHSPVIDEIPVTLAEVEQVPAFGTEWWWSRWSFAWTRVLLDRTDGRLERALLAQATLTVDEQRAVLVPGDRLDGFVNFAYRALKSERDGRPLERRLDAAESVAWLLDTVFALHGRVRPYNKYLAWELHEHPLPDPAWAAPRLLPLVEGLLDGEAAACRAAFAAVDAAVRAWDARHGGSELGDLVDGWGDELAVLRG